MSITADILISPQPVVVAVPPPQPRPAVAPASERDAANNQRGESSKNQNGPLSFRAALSATSSSGVVRTTNAAASTHWLDEGEERVARETRLPDAGPIELTGAEAADLFTRAVANNARQSRAPAFAAATSQYIASYFAGSSFYARPGETLEMTA